MLQWDDKLRTLVETMSDGLMVVDNDDVVHFVSDQLSRMLGYPSGELLGRVGYEALFDEPERRLIQEMNLRRTHGISEAYEIQMRAKGGRPVWVRISAAPITGPDGRVVGSFGLIADLTAHRETEEALRGSEERFRTLADASLEGIVIHDEGAILECNRAFAEMFSLDRARAGGTQLQQLAEPGSAPVLAKGIRDAADEATEVSIRRWDETPLVLEVAGRAVPYRGRPARAAIVRDITARRSLEEQLLQSQKMEAVGQLAGGVAHDFNNLLTAILGQCSLLRDDVTDERWREPLEEIWMAGRRAATLTQQLLALSRQQVLEPREMDLNASIAAMENMLRRLIGEHIEWKTTLAEGLWPVRADPGQVDQVIMNLVVNARDAMPRGGLLTVSTRNVSLETPLGSGHLSVAPGEYAAFCVRDTGIGIDESTKARLFEPFFTTKEMGKGTGLGLATVYGIVRQSGGNIRLESTPGAGAAFEVFLPRLPDAEVRQPAPTPAPSRLEGSETILLAEDEDLVRSLIVRALEGRGYRVVACEDGNDALRRMEAFAQPIDLLLTDLMMPGMSGRALAKRVVEASPGTRVLYMSGYTEDWDLRREVEADGAAFLQKPFAPPDLLRRVRAVLDG